MSAQTIPSADLSIIQQQQERIQQENEQRRLRDEENFRRSTPSVTLPSPLKELSEPRGSRNCVQIAKIILDGNTVLSETTIHDLVAGYQGECVNVEGLDNLIKDVTNAYIAEGYTSARVYIGPQDLKQGNLVLTVMEGLIEDLQILEDEKPRSGLDTAFPTEPGNLLNLRDIEQGLDQINRLALYDAKIRLEPGSKPGTTKVYADVTKTKPWWFRSGVDNSGSDSTGKTHAQMQVGLEDILGLYDKWTFKVGHDAEPNDHGKRSRDLYGAVSIPLGYWTLNFSTQQFDYLSMIRGSSQTFLSSGVSRTYIGRIDRLIHRDDAGTTTLSVDLSSKVVRNYVEGLLLESSSRKLTHVGLELTHLRRLWGGTWTGGIKASQGVPWLGAASDNERTSGSPKAESFKTVFSSSYYYGFNLGEQPMLFTASGSFQYSPHTLYSTEQISAGGLYTVRGFRNQSISGNSGGYLRSELTWGPKVSWGPVATKWLGTPQLFVALDAGWVPNRGNETATPGVVKGFTIGHRLKAGRVLVELGLEEPLDMPSSFTANRHQFYFNLGVKF